MTAIERLIESDLAAPRRILVVGDGMIDIYVHGSLEGNCQEGCQKFVEKSRVAVPGGAANAVCSLKNWYVEKVFLFDLYLGSVKTRFMVDNKCVFRLDNDIVNQDFARQHGETMQILTSKQLDAVLISDYDKGALTPEFIRDVVYLCAKYEVPCVADAKREPRVYAGAIIKCNEDYRNYYHKWWEKCHEYVVTLGERGPVCRSGGYDTQIVCGGNLPLVNCVNHVGAGDCFAAHLALALAHGFSLEDAATIAHSAGRVYVRHPHNRPPWPHEIKEDMEHEHIQ